MLFQKSTEAGIQLENALILPTELVEKTSIPANKDRILALAKELEVNVSFALQEKSDFNCFIGVMLDTYVSERICKLKKLELAKASKEIIELISRLPSDPEEAEKDKKIHDKVVALRDKFVKDVKKAAGEDVIVDVEVYKIPDRDQVIEYISNLLSLDGIS